jgi:hypothetical protein
MYFKTGPFRDEESHALGKNRWAGAKAMECISAVLETREPDGRGDNTLSLMDQAVALSPS